MKIKKCLLAAVSFAMYLFATGADFEQQPLQTEALQYEETEKEVSKPEKIENNESENKALEYKEYAFFTESKEKAMKTAEMYSAKLISFSNGIGVLALSEDITLPNGIFSVNSQELPMLYPEYLYTVELEDGNVNEDEEKQWHLQATNTEKVWDITKGKGIRVAVIDTGADLEHSDLKEGIVFADTSIPESEYEDGGRFLSSYMGAQDYFGHGTHVIGIVGARDNGFGCKGIAPECEIISIKSLEKQGSRGIGKTSWVVAGIQKAIENNANVINLSLGGTAVKDEMLLKVIQEAAQKGVVVVCAAGNITGSPKVFYPGAYEETIAVSGLMKSGEGIEFATSYSNYGDWIDISAPGSTIMSTIIGGYGTKTGTSMASPIVAGSIALLLANDSALTKTDILHLLYDSATDMGDEGKDDKYGYGAINIEKMFELYKDEYIVPNPVAKIPDKSVVGEGTAIVIEVPENVQKIVYTLDNTEPAMESESFPKEGIIFDEQIAEVTINTRSVMPNGKMGKVTTFNYSFVKGVVEAENNKELENEVIPQYGAYLDPVLKLPCRRYKLAVDAKNTLTAYVSGNEINNINLNLFDSADENGKLLAEAKLDNNKGTLNWKNKTKKSVDVWISITKKEEATEDYALNYSLSWKCEKVKDNQNKENQNKEDNNTNGNTQNNSQENTASTPVVQETAKASQETKTEEVSTESFTYEEDWLYTMTEVYVSQETENTIPESQDSEIISGVEILGKTSEKNDEGTSTMEAASDNHELETASEETSEISSTEDKYSYLENMFDDEGNVENDNKDSEYNIFLWAAIAALVIGMVIFIIYKVNLVDKKGF